MTPTEGQGTGKLGGGGRPSLTRAQARLYIAGYVVLLAGTIVSGWAYKVAVDDEMADSLKAQARATRDYQGQMELIGGKANVLASEVQEWFSGLWHGRNLAYTLAVITLAAALACFYIAFALPDLPAFGEGPAKGAAEPKK
jgi:hypothetical protein